MSQPYHIRLATPADLPQVVQLDTEAFSPYGTAESPEIIHARQQVFPAGFVVAETEEGIIGYGSAEKWREVREPGLDENPLTTHAPDGRIFCITGMAVAEAFRGQGVGTALTQHLIETARRHHCTAIVLETTHAQAFYTRLGFHLLSERQERNVALTVMALELNRHYRK